MKALHRLLMAGTVFSCLVSIQVAEARTQHRVAPQGKSALASVIILAQAAEPEKDATQT